jgi:hypothetical protein
MNTSDAADIQIDDALIGGIRPIPLHSKKQERVNDSEPISLPVGPDPIAAPFDEPIDLKDEPEIDNVSIIDDPPCSHDPVPIPEPSPDVLLSTSESETTKSPIDEFDPPQPYPYPVPIPEPRDPEIAIMIVEFQIVRFPIFDAPPTELSPVPIPEPSDERLFSICDSEISTCSTSEVEETR